MMSEYEQIKLAEKAVKRSARSLVTYMKSEHLNAIAEREYKIEEAEKAISKMKQEQGSIIREALFGNHI